LPGQLARTKSLTTKSPFEHSSTSIRICVVPFQAGRNHGRLQQSLGLAATGERTENGVVASC
jgi:hypothetical protein